VIAPLNVLRAGMLVGGMIVIRAIARARVERRQRDALRTPLIDPVVLEAAFVAKDGDDPNLVAEVRDTIAHLNRQAWAEEFYGLPTQLAALDKRVPKAARATLHRLMARLIHADDRWLVLIGARTLSRIAPADADTEIGAAIDRLSQRPDPTPADQGLLAELGKVRAGEEAAPQQKTAAAS
jgi:hypothetical protein